MLRKSIFILALPVMFACSDKQKNGEAGADQALQTNEASSPRVKANAETTTGVMHMRRLLADFPSDPAPADYTALQSELRSELEMILQKCTMKGADHDSLHSFIEPVPGLITMIGDTANAKGDEAIRKLSGLLETYDSKFE